MAESFIIPVAAADALAWAAGKLLDRDLLLRSELRHEAIFFLTLPDISCWRGALEKIIALHKRGCIILIMATSNPIVAFHLERKGFKKIFTNSEGISRFVAPPDELTAALRLFKSKKCHVMTADTLGNAALIES